MSLRQLPALWGQGPFEELPSAFGNPSFSSYPPASNESYHGQGNQSLYIYIFFIAFFSLPPSPSLFVDPASRDNSLEILLTNPPKTDAHTIFCVPGCLEDQQEIPRRTNKLQPQAAPCSYPEGPERITWHGVLQPQVAPCHSQNDQRLELSMVFSYTSFTFSLFIFLRPLWQCRIGHHDGFNPQLSASHRTPCSVFHLHLCILHRVLIFWYWIWTEKRPAPPQPSHLSPDQTTSEAEILVSTRVCFLVIWLRIIFEGCSLLLKLPCLSPPLIVSTSLPKAFELRPPAQIFPLKEGLWGRGLFNSCPLYVQGLMKALPK